LSTDVEVRHWGLLTGAEDSSDRGAPDDADADADADADGIFADGAFITAYPTNIMKITMAHVRTEVFFGGFAPHFGQLFAPVLTCSPHSLHLTNAMSLSFHVRLR
jgi:hypothetical protein